MRYQPATTVCALLLLSQASCRKAPIESSILDIPEPQKYALKVPITSSTDERLYIEAVKTIDAERENTIIKIDSYSEKLIHQTLDGNSKDFIIPALYAPRLANYASQKIAHAVLSPSANLESKLSACSALLTSSKLTVQILDSISDEQLRGANDTQMLKYVAMVAKECARMTPPSRETVIKAHGVVRSLIDLHSQTQKLNLLLPLASIIIDFDDENLGNKFSDGILHSIAHLDPLDVGEKLLQAKLSWSPQNERLFAPLFKYLTTHAIPSLIAQKQNSKKVYLLYCIDPSHIKENWSAISKSKESDQYLLNAFRLVEAQSVSNATSIVERSIASENGWSLNKLKKIPNELQVAFVRVLSNVYPQKFKKFALELIKFDSFDSEIYSYALTALEIEGVSRASKILATSHHENIILAAFQVVSTSEKINFLLSDTYLKFTSESKQKFTFNFWKIKSNGEISLTPELHKKVLHYFLDSDSRLSFDSKNPSLSDSNFFELISHIFTEDEKLRLFSKMLHQKSTGREIAAFAISLALSNFTPAIKYCSDHFQQLPPIAEDLINQFTQRKESGFEDAAFDLIENPESISSQFLLGSCINYLLVVTPDSFAPRIAKLIQSNSSLDKVDSNIWPMVSKAKIHALTPYLAALVNSSLSSDAIYAASLLNYFDTGISAREILDEQEAIRLEDFAFFVSCASNGDSKYFKRFMQFVSSDDSASTSEISDMLKKYNEIFHSESYRVSLLDAFKKSTKADPLFDEQVSVYIRALEHAPKLSIFSPFRFAPKTLEQIVKNRINPNPYDKRPLFTAIFPRNDWNGAFLRQPAHFDSCMERFQVLAYEVSTDDEFALAVKESSTASRKQISTLLLEGHGAKRVLSFGDSDPRFRVSTNKDEKFDLDPTDTAQLQKNIAPYLSTFSNVLCVSCSVGETKRKQNGGKEEVDPSSINLVTVLADSLQARKVRVSGPVRPVTTGEIYFKIGADGSCSLGPEELVLTRQNSR